MDYTTLEVVKRHLSENSTGNDIDIQATIDAACRAIDSWCSRSFGLTDTETRVFEVSETELDGSLFVGDFVASEGLEVHLRSTPTGSDIDVEASPVAFPLVEREGWPQDSIELWEASGGRMRWHEPFAAVTAKWGWPYVPAQVKYAAALYATRLFRRFDTALGVTGSAEFGAMFVRSIDPDITAVLKDFKRRLAVL